MATEKYFKNYHEAINYLRQIYPGARVFTPKITFWGYQGKFHHGGKRYEYKIIFEAPNKVKLIVTETG